MEDTLEKCNLSKNQAKIYLALLQEEKSTSGNLARICGIDRRNTYDALAKLQKKGLVSSIKLARTTAYSAAPPVRLLQLLNEEKSEIEERERRIKKALPNLNKLSKVHTHQEVKVFCGKNGLKHLAEELLEIMPPRSEYYTFGGMAKDIKGVTSFFKRFHRRRSRKGIYAKMLLNETDREVGEERAKEKLTEVRYIKGEQPFPAAFHVYDSTVNILMWYDEPIGIQVKNEKIAEAFKSFFELMWKNADK